MRRRFLNIGLSGFLLFVALGCKNFSPKAQTTSVDPGKWKNCVSVTEKLILSTQSYKEWLKDCKKHIGEKSEDGEKLLSCGFRGPNEFAASNQGSEKDLEWGFHENWSGRISVVLWLRFNLESESVEEMIGDYQPIEFDRSQVPAIKKACSGE